MKKYQLVAIKLCVPVGHSQASPRYSDSVMFCSLASNLHWSRYELEETRLYKGWSSWKNPKVVWPGSPWLDFRT